MAKNFTTIVALTAAGGLTPFYDFRPPIGEDWEVTEIAASVFSGGTVPEVDLGLIDATVGVLSWMKHSGNTGAVENLAGWAGRTSIFINHDVWLRIQNADAAPVNVGISARLVKKYAPDMLLSAVVSGTATSAVPVAIRPPVGEDWLLTGVGSSTWDGASPNALPNTHVDITNGVITATVANNTIASRGWNKPFQLYLNNDIFAVLTPAAGATLSWSAVKTKIYGPNDVSDVISQVGVIPVGTTLAFQPADGEEWIITDVGCNAAFTAGVPTVQVDLIDALGLTAMYALSTANKGWFNEMRLFLNHTNWLRLTAVNLDVVGISGYKWRE